MVLVLKQESCLFKNIYHLKKKTAQVGQWTLENKQLIPLMMVSSIENVFKFAFQCSFLLLNKQDLNLQTDLLCGISCWQAKPHMQLPETMQRGFPAKTSSNGVTFFDKILCLSSIHPPTAQPHISSHLSCASPSNTSLTHAYTPNPKKQK